MKSRWALRFLLFVGAAMAAVALVLRTGWANARLCTAGAQILTRLLGQEVQLARCELDPLETSLLVEGIRIGSRSHGRPLFSARRLAIDLAPLAIGHRVAIERLEVDEPVVDLVVAPGEGGEEKSSGGSSRNSSRCLDLFDVVRIDEMVVRDAGAHVVLGNGSALHVEEVDLAVARRRGLYGVELAVTGASFASGEMRVPLESLAASAVLDPAEERLDLERLRAKAPGLQVEALGAITRLCDPVFALGTTVEASLPEVAALLAPSLENVAGRLSLDGTVSGAAGAPAVKARARLAEVAFDEFDLGSIELTASLGEGKAALDELIWPVGEGRAIVRGEVELASPHLARVDVWTEGLRFEELLARLPIKNTPVQMVIDSEHHLAGPLAGGLALEGTSRLSIRDFRVRNEPWHVEKGNVIVEVPGTATLDTRVRLGADAIVLEQAQAAFGTGTTLQISSRLSFAEADGLDIRVRSPHFDLRHIRSHVAGIPLAGAGEIEAQIAGPYSEPLIEGDIDLREAGLFSARLGHIRSHVTSAPGDGILHFVTFEGERGSTGYEATARLLLGAHPAIEGSIALHEGGRLGDLFAATAGLVTPIEWLRDNLDGSIVSATASVKGPLPHISAQGQVVARGVRLLDRPFDSLVARLEVPDITELRLPELHLTRGGGRALGQGTIRFDGKAAPTVDAELDASDLPLRDLLGTFGEWARLGGGVGARGHIRGPIDALDIGGELFTSRVSAAGVELPSTRLSLETQGDEVIVRGPVAQAGTLSGAVRLAENLPFDAVLELDVPRIARYLPRHFSIDGMVRGAARATGTLADITSARGTIDLERLALVLAGYRLEGAEPARLAFDAGSFSLPSLRLLGENTELFLAGTRAASGALDLEARGNFDGRLLDSLVPQIEHTTGQVEIHAAVTGTDQRPVVVGSANVRRGGFRVKALPVQVQRFNGRLAFSQNQVLVEDASLMINQGRARLHGAVSLADFIPDRFDLTLDGERVSWRMPADWPAVVSGRLHLGGAWPDRLELTGELDVDRLRYARDLDLERAMLDFRQRIRQPPGPDEREWLRLDVDLVGGPDMRIDNNMVRARLQFVAPPAGKPRLKLVGTNVRIGLLGSVEILDGIGFFRGNQFRLTHGVVEFDRRTAIDPEFDLTAETEVRDYRVAVHAWGRLGDEDGSDFQLELASEPSLTQADIITLLTFGITSKDLDRGGNAYVGAGVAAEALLTVSGLDEHVRRWLPEGELLLDPEFTVTSQYSEATGQMEPMATFQVRLLSDQLRFHAAAPFSSPRGRRASAEYRVSERLSTQIVWENEETGYSAGDLGLDVKLHWEWE